MNRIAIFASGNGTNAQNIIEHFSAYSNVEISLILSDNEKAFVLERAKKLKISSYVFSKNDLTQTKSVLQKLKEHNINFIVLAGFLLMIPENILNAYPNKIVNIHPALLPKYGGKGMYGNRVHKTVIESGDKESGISIHYVNKEYDEGQIIFQAKCQVSKNENHEILAKKIHQLEYEHYPKVIEELIKKL